MFALKLALWGFLAVLGAAALAFVTGFVYPHEKVNGLWLVVAAACIYVLAYRFYGRWLAKQVVELNNQRVTPAVRLNDGVNFHPTNKVVLFGHHFAAIAGAGPLLGPVLAAQFGFLPGFLWLVIGAVLAGAVQDFIVLVASMRRNGRSLPEIAHDELGSVTGTATAVAVLFIVVVALAGLGFAVVNALYRNAWGTFTIAMTIPIGFIMGFYLQKFRPGAVAEVSVLGVALLIAAVLFGRVVAQSSFASWFEYERATLVWLLAGYGFLASVLPGWMLLVCCVGNFDGVHLGHQALIRRAREVADSTPGTRVIAMVFDPHPFSRVAPERTPARLSLYEQRRDWLLGAGADEAERLDPASGVLERTPEEFVDMLARRGVLAMVEGADFRFGARRAGDADALLRLGRARGMRVEILQPVHVALGDCTVVRASSTMLRFKTDQPLPPAVLPKPSRTTWKPSSPPRPTCSTCAPKWAVICRR